jgi:hypothetical protein
MTDAEETEEEVDEDVAENRRIVERLVADADMGTPDGVERLYERLALEVDREAAKAYSIDMDLEENDVIEHGTFGLGFVIEQLSPQKVDVLFDEGFSKLVCNQ